MGWYGNIHDYGNFDNLHDTLNLFKSICVLEQYPQFCKFAPKLKKELEARFREVKPNKKGLKRIHRITMFPNGLVMYKNPSYDYYSHNFKTVIKPFKFVPEEKKTTKKVSMTRSYYKNKYQHLENIYMYIALEEVGVNLHIKKTSPGYIGEKNLIKIASMERKLQEQKLPRDTKNELLISLLYKAFENKFNTYWMNNHIPYKEDIDVNEILIRTVVRRLFNYRFVDYASRNISCKGKEYEDSIGRTFGEEFTKNQPKKYFFEFVVPTKVFIDDLKSNNFCFNKGFWDGEEDKKKDYIARYESYAKVPIHFDTVEEFLEQFKSAIVSLKNEKYNKILKKLGFEIEDEKKETNPTGTIR